MNSMPTIHSEGFFARFEDQFRPFIAQLGIPETVFTHHDVEVATSKYAELLETVGRESNPYIGLEMGQSMTVQDMGVVGYALEASPDIGTMLTLLSKYLYVFSQSNILRLDVGEYRAAITYEVTILSPDQLGQELESSLAYTTTIMRQLSGVNFTPNQIEFQRARPPSTTRQEQFFGCEVSYDRPANRIHFDRKILNLPITSSKPGLLEALRFYLDDQLKVRSEEEDIVSRTRHLISSSLVSGMPDQKRIADQLGMSARTLQRRLRDKEVVFADLVDDLRYAIAQDYVLHSGFSLTDIAIMLGYGQLSAFSRAYKRWAGRSPESVRKSLKGTAG
jgi:AraC-like DNA-binding protein